MATLTCMSAIAERLRDLPATFTYPEALRTGLSDRQLQRLQKQGAIEKIARGLYQQGDVLENPDLLELTHRAPRATLCLTSALSLHSLTDEIPSYIHAAIPRDQRPPSTAAPIQWHRFDSRTFDIGRQTATIEGVHVWVYGPERSICDAFRLRHMEGHEQATDALKRWLGHRASKPGELLRIAREFGPRAETPIREALQVLL